MKLEDKIVQVLTETRVVLPGAQALLGFQLAMTLMEGYERPAGLLEGPSSRGDLRDIALTVVFLMAPPAFHPHRRRRRGHGEVPPLRRLDGAGRHGHPCRSGSPASCGSSSASRPARSRRLMRPRRWRCSSFYGLWFFAMLVLRARRLPAAASFSCGAGGRRRARAPDSSASLPASTLVILPPESMTKVTRSAYVFPLCCISTP